MNLNQAILISTTILTTGQIVNASDISSDDNAPYERQSGEFDNNFSYKLAQDCAPKGIKLANKTVDHPVFGEMYVISHKDDINYYNSKITEAEDTAEVLVDNVLKYVVEISSPSIKQDELRDTLLKMASTKVGRNTLKVLSAKYMKVYDKYKEFCNKYNYDIEGFLNATKKIPEIRVETDERRDTYEKLRKELERVDELLKSNKISLEISCFDNPLLSREKTEVNKAVENVSKYHECHEELKSINKKLRKVKKLWILKRLGKYHNYHKKLNRINKELKKVLNSEDKGLFDKKKQTLDEIMSFDKYTRASYKIFKETLDKLDEDKIEAVYEYAYYKLEYAYFKKKYAPFKKKYASLKSDKKIYKKQKQAAKKLMKATENSDASIENKKKYEEIKKKYKKIKEEYEKIKSIKIKYEINKDIFELYKDIVETTVGQNNADKVLEKLRGMQHNYEYKLEDYEMEYFNTKKEQLESPLKNIDETINALEREKLKSMSFFVETIPTKLYQEFGQLFESGEPTNTKEIEEAISRTKSFIEKPIDSDTGRKFIEDLNDMFKEGSKTLKKFISKLYINYETGQNSYFYNHYTKEHQITLSKGENHKDYKISEKCKILSGRKENEEGHHLDALQHELIHFKDKIIGNYRIVKKRKIDEIGILDKIKDEFKTNIGKIEGNFTDNQIPETLDYIYNDTREMMCMYGVLHHKGEFYFDPLNEALATAEKDVYYTKDKSSAIKTVRLSHVVSSHYTHIGFQSLEEATKLYSWYFNPELRELADL